MRDLTLVGALLLFSLFSPATADAEEPTVGREPSVTLRHHVGVEAGGPAVLGGVGYELQPIDGLGLRATLGAVPVCFSSCAVVPVSSAGASYWTPGGAHHLELDASLTYAWMKDDDARFVVPGVGYRYQRIDAHLVVRVLATPLLRLNDLGDVQPWGEVSVGYVL